MTHLVRDLIQALRPDDWRREAGFSAEMRDASTTLFNADSSPKREAALGSWLSSKHQPCLFGRAAASLGLMRYCILTEEELTRDDEDIQARIQAAREEWRRDAFKGAASGFVILLLSEAVAQASADDNLLELAKHLTSLYLLDRIEPGTIMLDDIFLEVPVPSRPVFHWRVGVNFFGSQADGRWWQDHRIPGGIALSVNSVGHMVKSSVVTRQTGALLKELGIPEEQTRHMSLETLGRALIFAMRTIAKASEAVSGKATTLLRLPPEQEGLPRCPVALPADLEGMNHCTYRGFYHTDVTLPREYFRPDLLRPAEVQPQDLDFTYLFSTAAANPEFYTMGSGVRVRAGDVIGPVTQQTLKGLKMGGRELSEGEATRLVARLFRPRS